MSHDTVSNHYYGPVHIQGEAHQKQQGPGTMYAGGMQQQQTDIGAPHYNPGTFMVQFYI